MAYRAVIHVLGILLITLGASMAFPMFVDLYDRHDDWIVFFTSMLLTLFFGGMLFLTTHGTPTKISIKQGFLMITASWLTLCIFSAAPFWLGELKLSITDSVFEAVSGLTTTGSTILTDLEHTPRGILLWRAMLQWLGGIGVILMAMSIMPFLKIGGMQLFVTELSESEKALPRAAQLASSIGSIYVVLTIICAICYRFTGMSPFSAITHAMTTISTGGYSIHDDSFMHFSTFAPLIVCCIFMTVGGIPFVLYLKAIRGNAVPLFTDAQVRAFTGIIFIAVTTITIYLVYNGMPLAGALMHSAFNVISVLTGTGFASADYGIWGGYAVSMIFFLSAVGACAGSTTCGIKIFRFQVLYAIARSQIKKLLYPHGVFVPTYNDRPVPSPAAEAVMGFFFLYALFFSLIAIALSFTGLDFITAMSGAVTAISNVGPGLGETIGPTGNFEPLSNAAKWILSTGMILGRLELFPVLVMLTPSFWAK